MSMKKPDSVQGLRREKDTTAGGAKSRESIQLAIAEAIGEYRKQIADIRARHGRKKRRSILELT